MEEPYTWVIDCRHCIVDGLDTAPEDTKYKKAIVQVSI